MLFQKVLFDFQLIPKHQESIESFASESKENQNVIIYIYIYIDRCSTFSFLFDHRDGLKS